MKNFLVPFLLVVGVLLLIYGSIRGTIAERGI